MLPRYRLDHGVHLTREQQVLLNLIQVVFEPGLNSIQESDMISSRVSPQMILEVVRDFLQPMHGHGTHSGMQG